MNYQIIGCFLSLKLMKSKYNISKKKKINVTYLYHQADLLYSLPTCISAGWDVLVLCLGRSRAGASAPLGSCPRSCEAEAALSS